MCCALFIYTFTQTVHNKTYQMQLMEADMDYPKTNSDSLVYLALVVEFCEGGFLRLNVMSTRVYSCSVVFTNYATD